MHNTKIFRRVLLTSLLLAACGDNGGSSNPDAGNVNIDGSVNVDASLADGSVDTDAAVELASLSISLEPVTTIAGETILISVAALDTNNNPVAAATAITLEIETNPDTGVLGGTLEQNTSGGTAEFTDLFINQAGVGYTIRATVGSVNATSTAFDITPGQAASLTFIVPPANAELMGPIGDVTVSVVDSVGNPVSSNDEVTISIGANPGETVLHSSGNGTTMLEVIDLGSTQSTGWFEAFLSGETRGVQRHPVDGLLYILERNNSLFSLNTDSGELIEIEDVGLNMRGLTFDPVGNRLLSVESSGLALFEIDPVTATETNLGDLTIANTDGFTALTIDPTTGIFYASAKTSDQDRRLVTVDVVNLTVTEIATFPNDGVAALSFRADGTLLASTGDGGAIENRLFTVDLTDASMVEIADVGSPLGDGECIEVMPASLRGTATVTAVDGVATFTDLRIDASGVGYTLEASTANQATITSGAFDVASTSSYVGVATLDVDVQTVAEDAGSVDVAVSIDVAQTHDVVLTYQVDGDGANPTDSDADAERFFNIRIPAGQTTATRSITINTDGVVDGDKTITLSLENTAMATDGALTSQLITIADVD